MEELERLAQEVEKAAAEVRQHTKEDGGIADRMRDYWKATASGADFD